MIELLLLALLGALFAAHRTLGQRVAGLERQIEELANGSRAAMPEVAAEPELPYVSPAYVAPATAARAVAPDPAVYEALEEPEPDGPPPPLPPLPSPPSPTPVETLATPGANFAGAFERLVGGRLLIWTGGIALGLAGLFLVRYSIELGLVGPRTRMIAAALFGLGLLGAGEWARRRVADDPRIGQALVGAGVLVLYAAAYGSHILYGLIGLGTAFALMALVALVALMLSLRHGVPAAVLGLAGGFLTPLLVGDADAGALPLLGYLTFLNLAVFAVAQWSGRHWLAWGARLLTLGWTTSLLFTAPDQALTIGAFLLVYVVGSGLVLGRDDEPLPSLVPTLVLLQLGSVVPLADYDGRGWAMVGALAVAGFALGARNAGLAAIPGRALPAVLLLLATHGLDGARGLPWLSALSTGLFAGGAWLALGRTGTRWHWSWIVCAAAAGPVLVARSVAPVLLDPPVWGLVIAALAILPTAWAWRLRAGAGAGGGADAPYDPSLLLCAITAAGLLAIGATDAFEPRWVPLAWMLVALATLAGGRRLADGGVLRVAVAVAVVAAIAAAGQAPTLWQALLAAVPGVPVLVASLPTPADAALLFGAPALLLFAMWRALPSHEPGLARLVGGAAAAFAGLLAYVGYKQIFALGDAADFVARGFAERTLLTQALFFAGWLLLRRPRLAWLAPVAAALTAVAAARFVWFDLLVLNPAAVTQDVGGLPGLNLLLPAYGGAAFWLYAAWRRAAREAEPAAPLLFGLFAAALLAAAALLVRQAFQGAVLTGGDMSRPEFYGYSLAGLVVSVALLLWGWRRGDTPLRVAGLALLTATVVKVFAVDAAALEGILRILSFLGLGVALIGMGKLYGTLLGRAPVK